MSTILNNTNITFNDSTAQTTAVKTTITSGSAPYYGSRAWVNFDGTATTPTPISQQNVSSITDGGVGIYTVNLTTALASANYASSVSGQSVGNNRGHFLSVRNGTNPTTSALALYSMNTAGTVVDCPNIGVIFSI